MRGISVPRALIRPRLHTLPATDSATHGELHARGACMTEFIGSGTPLTANGLRDILQSAELAPAEIWSVLSVENSGCGYLRDRRPKVLFERHIFSRLTAGRFDEDDPDISQRTAGGYGPAGSHQFDRLNAAIQLDRPAALKSASWGLGQVMGENFQPAGFTDVDTMVK